MKAKGAVRIKSRGKSFINLDGLPWLKPASVVITLACLVVSVVLLTMPLINKDIHKLQIDGPLEHVSTEQVRQALVGTFPGGFISLSVEDVVIRLRELPMVAHVEAEKVWPDTLRLTLHEEQPVAIWNSRSMLSQSGEVLPLALALLQLPQLKGRDGGSRLVMQHFQLFNHWGKRHSLSLLALNNTASGWQLIYADDFQIWLDSSQAMQGLQQLEDVLHQFDVSRIRRIDMRYEQGFAVAWKKEFQAVVQG
ncbi:MAG: FtsQ-type POTRA domain-containing protein [Bermanella sp.]